MLFEPLCIGIDLGVDSIKVAHLAKKRNTKTIKSLYKIENPIGKIAFDRPEEKDAICQCFAKINKIFPSKSAVIGISSKHLIFRNVRFPLLKGRELYEAIFWEIQEFSAMFNGEFISDYELLDNRNNTYHILLAAASKDIAMDYAKIAVDAGLPLKALDVYPLANARVLETQKKHGVTAIIDLNSSHSEITMVDNGKIVFNRCLDFFDINKIDDELCKIIKTDSSWFNNIKTGFDFLPLPYQNIILEISRTFEFYSLQSKGCRINEIMLIGKAGESHYCKDIFRSYFHIEVYTGREIKLDFVNENIKSNGDYVDYISAIGFALRG
ncbi:Type IV pilus assembly protein PilM [Tepidanaerobacter acetatoxydans Re1]|uniref:Type IV pilus assembly protein PilM n=1 Tax=Tepidanaerobacter acetatoxydans (strain DSM 21804 / JCM 16047 / Re1) TaxID=1209989 RepID=F4LVH3_TEPAE|nr:pilus assembly protein PilM [Tepidanaerobacter acetatoxydans]AEE91559.1 type IV pilus assembly protein PilM [Tepidanaerobacter acetatoxydans Re1]CCP26278.1 Type IV pilus assembly protein PilM [Tepidanaerobacter acetatoxydans Re1]